MRRLAPAAALDRRGDHAVRGGPAPRVLPLDAAPAQPWRNGGGRTRELLARPAGADWRVRISVADIDRDGPFSAFPGVARWFCVLQGAGVALRVDGVAHRLAPGDAPFGFDGGAPADCALLDGPTRDLNLMLRGVTGGMAAVGAAEWRPPGGACGVFALAAGRLQAGGRAIAVPDRALAWFDTAPGALRFAPCTAEDPNEDPDRDPDRDTPARTGPSGAPASGTPSGTPARGALAWWLWAGIDTTEDA